MPLFERDREAEAEIWDGAGSVHFNDSELPVPFGQTPWNQLPHAGVKSFFLNYVALSVVGFGLALTINTFLVSHLVVAAFSLLFMSWMFRRIAIKTCVAIKTTGQGRGLFKWLTPVYAVFVGATAFTFLTSLTQGGPAEESAATVAMPAFWSWALWLYVKFFVKVQFDAPTYDREVVRGTGLVGSDVAHRRAKQAAGGGPMLPWGAGLPIGAETQHFLLLGAPGSGKTLLMKFMMNWVIRESMPYSTDVRALVYDAKQDMLSYLVPLAASSEIPVITLNPFDERCAPWAIASDIDSPSGAQQLAAAIVPRQDQAKQPFFDNAARDILTGIINYFIRFAPGQWTLRDILLATEDATTVRRIIEKSPEARRARHYFERHETLLDVLSTINTHVAPFQFIAAAWAKAEHPPVSIRDWLRGSGVIVLGHSEENRDALDAINRLFFKRASELTLNGREVSATDDTRRTWFFLDEIREMGFLDGFSSLLTRGRSKGACVMIGFQDIAGLREVYGPDIAEEIAGLCSNKCFLRLEDPTSAGWASSVFSRAEVMETTYSESESYSRGKGGGSSSYSQSSSTQFRDVQAVSESELMSMKQTSLENGLPAYYKSPITGSYAMIWPGQTFDKFAPMLDRSFPAFVERPSSHQYLDEWDGDDLKRLGLSALELGEGTPVAPPESPSQTPRRPFGDLDGIG